jgi:hypothetical protein
MAPIPQTPKDEALHAVGRTIANFQRMEYLLKMLAVSGPIAGHQLSVEVEIAKRQDLLKTLTLGGAIAIWKKVLLGAAAKQAPVDDLFDITIRTTFDFGVDPEAARKHLEDIELLLSERNRLVHTDLIAVDWSKTEECEALVDSLTDKNQRIATQMEFLDGLFNDLRDVQRAAKAAVDSDEFLQWLRE